MSTSASPSNSQPRDAAAAQGAPSSTSFEDQLKEFWVKYHQLILTCCAAIVLAIAAKGAWDYLGAERERGIEADYARAKTPQALRAFADLHPGHPLAGVALLTLADQAYAEGRIDEAAAAYQGAEQALKGSVLLGRCRLGLAVARVQAGQSAEGEADLQALVDDSHQFLAVRSEAAYHLATLAAAAGRADQLKTIQTRLLQIDPSSPWTQRAFLLQVQSGGRAAAGPQGGAGSISFPVR